MKLIIKNDNRDIVKNPNIKIIETTEASFTNQIVFIEENDVPIIKFTDTEAMYFVKDLDNLYDRKSKSEVLINIDGDNLELIGSGASEPVDSRHYKVYTALLTQSGTDAPVATVLENTLGGTIVWSYAGEGNYLAVLNGVFTEEKTFLFLQQGNNGSSEGVYSIHYINNNTFSILTSVVASGVVQNTNELLLNTSIEIRVYLNK